MDRRYFTKLTLISSYTALVTPFISIMSFDNIKNKIFKKKFSKIWILDINDN